MTSKKIKEAKGEQKFAAASEAAVKEAEAGGKEWTKTFDAIADFVFIQDKDFKFVKVNKVFCDALKKKPEDLIGKKCYEILHKSDKPWPNCPLAKTLKDKRSHTEEVNDPNIGVPLLINTSPLFDKKGEVTGIVHIAKDITERKQAEKDREKVLQDMNERVKELNCLYGLSKLVEKSDTLVEEIFQGMVELLPPAWQYPDITCAKIAFEDKEFKTEGFKTSKWKQSADIKVHGERVGIIEVYYLEEKPKTDEGPFLKQERKLIDAIAERLGRITERKQAEKELQKREEFNWALFNYNPIETIVVDLEGRVVKSNLAKRKFGGRLSNIGDTMYKDYAGKHKIDMHAELMKCIKLNRLKKFPEQKYNDKILSITIAPFSDGAIITSEDITERKQLEDALRKSEQWFSTTLKSIGDAVIATDTKSNVIFLNSIAEFLTGWKQEEAIGKPLNKVFNIINEKTGKPAENPVKRVLREGVIVGLANHTVLIAKDGIKRPIADSGAPIKDDKRKVIGAVIVFRDITERKKAEERKSEFLSNVSHALRTPLTSIKSFTEILLRYKDVNLVEQRRFLATINKETNRLTQLINELLDLDKMEHDELEWKSVPCDILNIVQNSINVLDPLIKEKNITFKFNLPSQNLIANGNEDKLKDVIINLIGNAIKFTPSKGEIRITIEKKKETIEVSIADTGIGIPKDELTNIFERFNRLDNSINRKVTGTGLGLYICKQIIEKHEGKIWAESSGSKGTKFIFVLPEA